jgi:hypothetical protein
MTLAQFRAELVRPDARDEVQAGLDETRAARLNARANAAGWDEATGAAWVRIVLESDGATPEWTLAASTLAPSGRAMVIVMYFGAAHSDEARARAELEAVIRSIRPA